MLSAQKTSTQQFTEVEDIIGSVVFLRGGNACSVIEITASNFALLSKRDQDTKIYSYAAFLNSLTFPVQILIRNKRVDITSYLQLLEDQEGKTQNPLLIRNIRLYREFVHEMVKINVVLNKAFYVILTYSSLEGGIGGSVSTVKGASQKDTHILQATKSLLTKSDSLQGQLRRFAMSTKVLDKKELVKLFYDIFNENTEGEFDPTHIEEDVRSVFVKPAKAV
jgi:hypothetical protein